jgi:hypothetical protein
MEPTCLLIISGNINQPFAGIVPMSEHSDSVRPLFRKALSHSVAHGQRQCFLTELHTGSDSADFF